MARQLKRITVCAKFPVRRRSAYALLVREPNVARLALDSPRLAAAECVQGFVLAAHDNAFGPEHVSDTILPVTRAPRDDLYRQGFFYVHLSHRCLLFWRERNPT